MTIDYFMYTKDMKKRGVLNQIFDFIVNEAAPVVLEHISQIEQDEKTLNGTDLRLADLEQRIAVIEEQQHRIEVDKAWKGSFTRKIVIGLLMYLVIGSFLAYRQISDPWISAIVPVIGFLLSILLLPVVKKIWLFLQK